MRTERTPEERLIDSALSLALLSHVPDEESVGDRLKVMKLLFVADYQMFQQRAKGLNLSFYKYKFGPFSKEVEEVWDALKRSGHLLEEEEFGLTDEGRRLAKAFRDDVLARPQNKPFNDVITEVAHQLGGVGRDEIIRRVYDMKISAVDGRPYRVRDAPLGTFFTQALEPSEAKLAVHVDEGWLDTLSIVLDRSRRESLAHAMEQVRAGKTLTHEHVWPAV